MKLINIKKVNKTFENEGKKIKALKEIDIQINQGDFLCILGPSGCGKSTLLRCIAGLEKVTEGEILFDGQPVHGSGPDRMMVFQGFEQLLPWKTIFNNVAYPLVVNKFGNKEEIKSKAEEFIALVGLSDYKESFPHQLSGGMKQRVAIARALTLEPKVLLMDEPFASLDAQTRMTLQKELLNLWSKLGITVIFITHNIEEAIILGNRIAVMSKGPGTVKKMLEINLERPRTLGQEDFNLLWQELNNLMES